MRQQTFVGLSALALALVLLGFVTLGISRLFLPTDTARLLSAPAMLIGGALLVLLTIRSVLAVSGLRPLEE